MLIVLFFLDHKVWKEEGVSGEEGFERGEMGCSTLRPYKTGSTGRVPALRTTGLGAAVFHFGFRLWENSERDFPGQQLCG